MAFPLINPDQQFFGASGSPLVNGTVEFRSPSTNDLISSYPTADDANAQTNPNDSAVQLNERGSAPSGLFLEDGVAYKFILTDSDGNNVRTIDDVLCPSALDQDGIGRLAYPQTAAELAASVTPTNYVYEPGDVRRYGAVGDGVTDDATALQDAINSNASIFIPSGSYSVGSQISITDSLHINYGNVVIDASSAAGPFSDLGVIFFNGGALTALPDLSVSPSRGDRALTLASTPSLSRDDVFIIANPTDSTFSGHRTTYKEGEFCKAKSVSGSSVTIYDGLYSGYTNTSVDVYKMAGKKLTCSGGSLHVIAPGSGAVSAIRINLASECRLTNLSGENSDNATISINQCYDLMGVNIQATQSVTGGSGTDYGLSIANCQQVSIDGNFWGQRHASTVGGADPTGNTPNRNVHISGVFTNDTATPSVNAADHHGNCEFCSYQGAFNGGINVSGDNNVYKGIVRSHSGQNSLAVYCTEFLGFNFDLSGLMIDTTGDPLDSSTRGAIDIGGNQDTMDASTTRGGLLNLRGITFRCPDAERLISVRNRGATPTEAMIIDMSDVKVLQSDIAGAAGFRIDAVTGDNFDALYCDNVYTNTMAWSIANVDNVYAGAQLVGKGTWDPGLIADGDEEAFDVTVTGAELGDIALASLSGDVNDMVLDAQVTSANTVTCVLANNTGGSLDVGSSTVRVLCFRNFQY